MPYDSVFTNGVVAFASDDSVFQMRLVENTLHNFPHRLTYDAFTMYQSAVSCIGTSMDTVDRYYLLNSWPWKL